MHFSLEKTLDPSGYIKNFHPEEGGGGGRVVNHLRLRMRG